jgi:predicted extracellular nuclease
MFGFAILVWFISGFFVLGFLLAKRWRNAGIAAAICAVGFVTAAVTVPPSDANAPSATPQRPRSAAHRVPGPHHVAQKLASLVRHATKTERTAAPAPAWTTADEKRAFIASVDESITGKRIAGNSRKFIGAAVDLHGVVVNVLDDNTFNFRTGDISMDENGNVSNTLGMIVVRCNSTRDLEADQQLRVLGTVVEPMEGSNLMGASTTFPTVEAKYME